jgi:pyruvate dehydrogenase E2 component (dihydrolipoamide acetyltransferase)
VKPGDTVQKDQPLLTLETDKATMDLPSPGAGVLKEFFVAIGTKVNKGSRIASLEVAEGGGASRRPSSAPAARTGQARAAPRAPVLVAPYRVSNPRWSRSPRLASDVRKPASHKTPAPEELSSVAPPPPLASVKVKVARQSHPSGAWGASWAWILALVKGTGRHGRVLEQDVKSYVKEHVGKAVAASGGFVLPEAPFVDFARFGLIESQPLSRIKRVTATHLHGAWLRVVHVTQHDEADITDLEGFRKSESEQAKKRNVHLTLLPFIMKAVVATLKAFPTFNASLDPRART